MTHEKTMPANGGTEAVLPDDRAASAKISRRGVLGALSVFALAGCTTSQGRVAAKVTAPAEPAASAVEVNAYRAMPDEKFPIPAVDPAKIPKQFRRQRVRYETTEPVGSVVVDTGTFFLHLVEEDGMAMRYGCGLGRAGFAWSGRARIAWKQEWPKWTPPEEMIERDPSLEKWSAANGGMPPGPMNPLGARAHYIFKDGKDTLYRVHGSPEYWSIGKAVSSGCVRLIQQDVIDLYGRVKTGAPILVI